MTYLGDYLGQLLSEIIMARAQADLETLRMAELYSSHPYLKNFPIPHLRLPTITLDLPYVAENIEKAPVNASPRGKIDTALMRKKFNALLTQTIALYNYDVDKKTTIEINRALDAFLKKTKVPQDIEIGVRFIATGMTEIAADVLKNKIKLSESQISQFNEFTNTLKQTTLTEFLSLRKTPPRIDVLLTNKELLDIKNPELFSHLHISITEQGQEWTTIESKGKSIDKLVPE
jgi:hypothetical protein